MRDIKFRAWGKVNKEMLHWQPNYDIGIRALFANGNLLVNHPEQTSDMDFELYSDDKPKENFELMQFTGLKDRNGVDIFEGDIVTADTKEPRIMNWPCRGFIEFINWGFSINVGKQSLDNENDYYAHFWTHENFEVIGNIYQNPELLTTPNRG